MAKDTSNYVGGRTQIIVVRDNGMHVEDAKNINALEERVNTFNRTLAEVVRLCPDLSIPDAEFQASLRVFEDTVNKLRNDYFQSSVIESLQQAMSNPEYKGDSYLQFPIGVLAKSGKNVTKYKETHSGHFAATVSVSPSHSPSASPSASRSPSPSSSPSASPSEENDEEGI